MAWLKHKNFAKSVLVGDVDLPPDGMNVPQYITVATGAGVRFPQDGNFTAIIYNNAFDAPSDDASAEIVTLLWQSGDMFLVVSRGNEGTVPVAWKKGYRIVHTATAAKFQELEAAIDNPFCGFISATGGIATQGSVIADQQLRGNSLKINTVVSGLGLFDPIGNLSSTPNTADALTLLNHTFAQMKVDIGLGDVENRALSLWAGSGNITTVGQLTSLNVKGSNASNVLAGDMGVTDWAGISLSGSATSGNYNFLSKSGSPLLINRPAGQNIYFRLNNTDQMALDTTGRLSIIGTTGTLLSLGNTTSTGSATPTSINLGGTYSTTSGANSKLLLYDNGGGGKVGLGFDGSNLNYNAYTGTGHAFYVNGSKVAGIDSSGNVGVGCTPSVRLDVQGGSARFGSGAYVAPTAGDVSIARESAPTTGFIYFGNTNSHFIGYDGTYCYLGSGASYINGTSGALTVTTTSGLLLALGATTALSTATPVAIDMGGSYSPTAGANAKLRIVDIGGAIAGLGYSSATVQALDYLAPTSAHHNFFCNGTKIFGIDPTGFVFNSKGANVASAATITPTGEIFHITGTAQITTINVPYTGFTGTITIIPDGLFTTGTTGNIALGSTAVVSRALNMTFDGTKWYPSY